MNKANPLKFWRSLFWICSNCIVDRLSCICGLTFQLSKTFRDILDKWYRQPAFLSNSKNIYLFLTCPFKKKYRSFHYIIIHLWTHTTMWLYGSRKKYLESGILWIWYTNVYKTRFRNHNHLRQKGGNSILKLILFCKI